MRNVRMKVLAVFKKVETVEVWLSHWCYSSQNFNLIIYCQQKPWLYIYIASHCKNVIDYYNVTKQIYEKLHFTSFQFWVYFGDDALENVRMKVYEKHLNREPKTLGIYCLISLKTWKSFGSRVLSSGSKNS